jgi:hypothetical protein
VLVTTTQGESLYEVRSVERRPIGDEVFDPAGRDRLLLVTSASASPWNTADATVVTAELVSAPFVATPQGGRLEGGSGRTGEVTPLGLGLVAFFGLALAAALVLAVRMQRTRGSRAAYLLAAAPVLGLTILAAEHASRLLPGWW